MPEETPTENPTPNDVAEATTGRPGETPEQTINGLREALAKANAEAQQHRVEARDAKAKVEEFETANLTETQRLQKERDEATSALSSTSLTIARYEAAEAAGIPLAWAKRLVGSTADELKADAETVKAQLGQQNGRNPAPDRSQGGAGGNNGDGTTRTGGVSAGRDLFAESRGKK